MLKITFVTLSAIDFFSTAALLDRCGEAAESNPVAVWFYENFHVAGLAVLKVAAVLAALLIYRLAARSRPDVGHHFTTLACRPWLRCSLMGFACAVTGWAVAMGIVAHVITAR